MNQESKNKKIIMSLIGLMVLIGAVIGGFAFNELLNADAKDRLVAKISSYQIKEMNDRMNSVVEEWKEQGIFKLSKKELINELKEIESSAKEAKEELVSAETFLGEYRVEGAKYSKMPSYPSYEALLAKFETSMNNKDFKAMKEEKDKVEEGLEILKNEEKEEKEREEKEDRELREEVAQAREDEKNLKNEKKKEEEGARINFLQSQVRDYLQLFMESINNRENRVQDNINMGTQPEKALYDTIDYYRNNEKGISEIKYNLDHYKKEGNSYTLYYCELYRIEDYDTNELKDHYQEVEYTWKISGEEGNYEAEFKRVALKSPRNMNEKQLKKYNERKSKYFGI